MGNCFSFQKQIEQIVDDANRRNSYPGTYALHPIDERDVSDVKQALNSVLLFSRLDDDVKHNIVSNMMERQVNAGDIITHQGDNGSEMFVVKDGVFNVMIRKHGRLIKMNVRSRGHCFGEVALMYSCPRTATIIAATDGKLWILTRESFKNHIKDAVENERAKIEVFLNNVPLLQNLSKEDKSTLIDAVQIEYYKENEIVVQQGAPGDKFYIIKDGEADVLIDDVRINTLYTSDFFGETALLKTEARVATIRVASCRLEALVIDRKTFDKIIGPLEAVIDACVIETSKRMHRFSTDPHMIRMRTRTEVELVVNTSKTRTLNAYEDEISDILVRTLSDRGSVYCNDHIEIDINSTCQSMHTLSNCSESFSKQKPCDKLVLEVMGLLGKGAFSSVYLVMCRNTRRAYALKQIPKKRVAKCIEHIFQEKNIGMNIANSFCIRQYATFQDMYCLYILLECLEYDVMHVLRSVCKQHRVPAGLCSNEFSYWIGIPEDVTRFYAACVILGLEHLHRHNIVYRDLKPENVLIDTFGYAKLADFGMAKILPSGSRAFTLCGTPGYLAPEVIVGKGYNKAVDFWSLGVFIYVMLTATQPFDMGDCIDPMDILKKIANDNFEVSFPDYVSSEAEDLISRLLDRRPYKRLGMLKGRFSDIKKHSWFKDFDWGALASKQIVPPNFNLAPRKIKKYNSPENSNNFENNRLDIIEKYNKIFELF